MYGRVAISAAGASPECIVLLAHTPCGSLSFARPGDESWTSLPEPYSTTEVAIAVYNERDGLFYTLCEGGVVCTFDLSNPSSPAAVRPIAYGAKRHSSGSAARHSHYLLFTPCNAILVVTRRFARALDTPRGGGVATTDLWIHKVRGRDWTCLGDNALILGRNSPLCLPIKDYPMLRPNCAYLTDDLQHTTRQSGGATSASGTSRPGACRSLTISGLSFLGWIHHHRFGLRHLFTRLGT